MANREKLEIPTIEFTSVTLLDTSVNSSCTCVKKPPTTDCADVWSISAVNPDCTTDKCASFGE